MNNISSSSALVFWTAPKSLAKLADSGSSLLKPGRNLSSWHITKIAPSLFRAGHFSLTGHGDALDAQINNIPTGRTPGRALRNFRRKLRKSPIAFA